MYKRGIYIISSFLVVVVILVFAMPRRASFGYDYKKGQVWKYETLYSPMDFPILKTEEQIREDKLSARSMEIPYYRCSSSVAGNSLLAVDNLALGQLSYGVTSALKTIYKTGVVSDEGIRQSDGSVSTSEVVYIQKDKRAAKYPAKEVLKLSDARKKLLSLVMESEPEVNVDSIFRAQFVYDLVLPNLVFDPQTTELVNSGNGSVVSPTLGYVSSGQLIVSEGEIVTSEIAQMLDSLKKEYEANVGISGSWILYWLGRILIALAITAILALVIYFANKSIFTESRLQYLLLIFTVASLMSLLCIKFNENLLYIMPFTLTALYLQAFFKPRFIVPVYAVSLLPLLIFAHDGAVLYVMFMAAGLVAILLFNTFGKGWKQFVLAAITYGVLAIVYMAFHMLDLVQGDIFTVLLRLLAAAFLPVAGFPLVYLFERIFNLVSTSRLIEMCDISNPLIRELELKAPGTFHHSLQVMNMADSVARAVDANVLLVRTGALYHDIGKMENPQCFVENESLVIKADQDKYHYGLPPQQSAHDIIQHVSAGVVLAEKHRIPSIIVDFIRTHHGTSRTGYFYGTYLKEGGDPEAAADFTYPGPRSHTKEQIILMLCDSIEAASRTLSNHSAESISAFVDRIIAGKEQEGQLEDADISIHELGIVKDTLKQYLAQMFHERITYPEKRNKKH